MQLPELVGSGVVGSLITGVMALVVRYIDKRKHEAEIGQLRAATSKTQAEADDLVSGRLIRELDRISEVNEQLGRTINLQREEIDRLRERILAYAQKESEHAVENAALRHEIARLKESQSPIGVILDQAYPVQIHHQPNEFDEEE